MHRVALNQLSLKLLLRPRSAFLVKEGDKASALLHPEHVDLQPMRTGTDSTVFIPGSSLKGAFRSATERTLRTLSGGQREDRYACDPFDQRNPCHSAGDRRAPQEKALSSAEIHARQCLACRTYGSRQLRGRLSFADALPSDEKARAAANRVEPRTGVGIDRRTGAARNGALFEMEVVAAGSFSVHLHATNVQLWQVALLASVIEEIELGLVRVGGSTTRGLGAMRVRLEGLDWWQAGTAERPAGICALGRPLDPAYGWLPDGELPVDSAPERARGGRRWRWDAEGAAAVLAAAQDAGWSHLDGWRPPARER